MLFAHHADCGSHGASRAVTAHNDAARINSNLCAMLRNPFGCGIGFFIGYWILCFRGEAILHENDCYSRSGGNITHRAIMRLKAAYHPSAAVKVNECRKNFLRCLRTHRSEEHTSELQSRQYLVCRLLLEKKKKLRVATYYAQSLV